VADFRVAVAGKLQLGDPSKGLISEFLKAALVLFDHHRGKLRARLVTDEPVGPDSLFIVPAAIKSASLMTFPLPR